MSHAYWGPGFSDDEIRAALDAKACVATHVESEAMLCEKTARAKVNGLIAQINPAVLRTLTRDSPAFQNFKRHVMSLPRSGR